MSMFNPLHPLAQENDKYVKEEGWHLCKCLFASPFKITFYITNLWGKRAELACSRPIVGLNQVASLRERLRLRSVPGSRSLEAESRLDLEPEPIICGLAHPWPPGQPGLCPRGWPDLDTEAASAGSEMMRPPWPAEKSIGAWWACSRSSNGEKVNSRTAHHHLLYFWVTLWN